MERKEHNVTLAQVFGGVAVVVVLVWSVSWPKTPAWLDGVLLVVAVVTGGLALILRRAEQKEAEDTTPPAQG